MLLTLQKQIADAIGALPYFSGVTPITERAGDIETEIDQRLAEMQFCVVVQTAQGEDHENPMMPEPLAAIYTERFVVSCAQTPLTDEQAANRNVVDGIEQIILCLHGLPIADDAIGRRVFRVKSHQSIRTDDGRAIQECVVEVIARLKPEPTRED